MAKHTMDTNKGAFGVMAPSALRNLHSTASSHTSDNGVDVTPTSNYVSLSHDVARAAEWGGYVFRFDIWRSDLWQGGVDWDRGGVEAEWLAEGDTRIHNVEVSVNQGATWNAVVQGIDPVESTFSERLAFVN
jgi:hypothetical protein